MEKTNLFNKHGRMLTINEAIDLLPPIFSLENVTRVEVIDQEGRSYVNSKPTNKTEISIQDDGKTLKVFITDAA